MKKVTFDRNPTLICISFHVVVWLIMIYLAISLAGCKARKVNKDYSKTVDKSQSAAAVSKRDSSNTTIQKSETKTEVKEDSSGYEKVTVIEYYEPSPNVPAGSPKRATIAEKGKSGSKAESAKNVDDFVNHSQINSIDSVGSNQNDIKRVDKVKAVETKDNTLQWWIGAGVFVLVVVIGLSVYFSRKKKGA